MALQKPGKWQQQHITVNGQKVAAFHNFNNQSTAVNCSMDIVRDNPGEPVPEETFTHSD